MPLHAHPFPLSNTVVGTANDTAANINVKGRYFMLANTGAQPLYFKDKTVDGADCTATNGMLVPAGTVFPVMMSSDVLSLISNATTTKYAIQYFDSL